MTVRPAVGPCVYPCVWDVTSYGGADVSEPAFRFEVKTAAADTFQLPLESGGTYDFNVDWGDGSESDITVWDHADTNHSYSGAGTYDVVITGTITGWRVAASTARLKIYDVSEWGPLKILSTDSAFNGCNNLTISATDYPNLTGVTSVFRFFRNCTSLTSIPNINLWDFSSTASFQQFFYQATSIDQNLASMDISVATSMSLFATGATFSTENWSNTLIGWLIQRPTLAIVIDGGNSKRNPAGTAAYNALVALGCTITDGGEE